MASGRVAPAGASAFKSALGNAAATTAADTLVLTTTAAIAVGDLVVVRWAADNATATTPTATSVTDSGGNTYTDHAFRGNNATANAGIVGGILATKATSAVASGGTITLTLSLTTSAHRAMYAESFTGFHNLTRSNVVVNSGASTASTVTSGVVTPGDLVVGAVAIESRTAPSAYDSDVLNGSWSSGVVKPSNTTGTDATLVEVAGQYKIPTASGAQVYNVTNANTDWAAMVVVFQVSGTATDPTEVAGLTAWYDADNAASFTYSSATRVSQWNDRTGTSGRHLVQATTGVQPDRSGTKNGHPTVVFTRSRNDRLRPSAWTNVAQPVTIFLVVRYTLGSVGHDTMQFDGGVAAYRPTYDNFEFFAEGGSAATIPIITNTYYVMTVVFSGASSKYRINGRQFDAGHGGTAGLIGTWAMGGRAADTGNSMEGEVCEVVVYNVALSDLNLGKVDNYLMAKWAIP
jgi:hypothetical protein